MSTNNDLITRTDEEQKRSVEIYDSFRDELLKRQLSNTENYDKSILTLSSAGLAISLTFLKFVVPIEQAQSIHLVKISWVCFLLSIMLSLIAYLISNAAITKQLSIAEDYYVNKLASAFNKKNWLSIVNNWLNYAVGFLFAAALISVVLFVITNLKPQDETMSDKETKNTKNVVTQESATIPTMQRVPVEGDLAINSAQIPTMQAAPGSSSQSQPSQSTTSQSQSNESK